MASLARRFTWKKWAPDVGENRELEGGPVLFLELATGLSAKQLHDIGDALGATREVKYASPNFENVPTDEMQPLIEGARKDFFAKIKALVVEAMGAYVRVFDGPHTVDGEPLATLDDYIAIMQQRADHGGPAIADLMAALTSFNSVTGPDELFSRRSSGGARSTDAQRPAKASALTAAH